MEFSEQECWSGLLFPSSGDPPDPGIQPVSPALQVNSLLPEPPGKPLFRAEHQASKEVQEEAARFLKGQAQIWAAGLPPRPTSPNKSQACLDSQGVQTFLAPNGKKSGFQGQEYVELLAAVFLDEVPHR